MRRTLSVVALCLALTGLAACSRSEAASPVRSQEGPVQAVARSPDGALPRLVFFQNPNGRPCQIQQGVLDDMRAELNGSVELVSYRTTSSADVAMFNQFGIRSLPTLVLTDAAGREVRRATPGIQGAGAVRRLIGQ